MVSLVGIIEYPKERLLQLILIIHLIDYLLLLNLPHLAGRKPFKRCHEQLSIDLAVVDLILKDVPIALVLHAPLVSQQVVLFIGQVLLEQAQESLLSFGFHLGEELGLTVG